MAFICEYDKESDIIELKVKLKEMILVALRNGLLHGKLFAMAVSFGKTDELSEKYRFQNNVDPALATIQKKEKRLY